MVSSVRSVCDSTCTVPNDCLSNIETALGGLCFVPPPQKKKTQSNNNKFNNRGL